MLATGPKGVKYYYKVPFPTGEFQNIFYFVSVVINERNAMVDVELKTADGTLNVIVHGVFPVIYKCLSNYIGGGHFTQRNLSYHRVSCKQGK